MVQTTPTLKGKTVAITRPEGQAEEAVELIKALGGVPYCIPAIEIKPLSNPESLKKFITELLEGRVNYVVLMSTNGVKYLLSAAQSLKLEDQLKKGLNKTYMIVVGPRTAEAIKEAGVRVDLVPNKYSSEGLLEVFTEKGVGGKTIRIPRTSNAAPTLTNKLREMDADVEEIYVYASGLPVDEVLKDKFYQDLTSGKIDAIVFGSGLSAKNIFKMLSEKAPMEKLRSIIKDRVVTVAIGPTTAQSLREMDVKVDVVPDNYLFEKALSSLAQYWSKQ
jgi:uroporphyrinogen-III synthase